MGANNFISPTRIASGPGPDRGKLSLLGSSQRVADSSRARAPAAVRCVLPVGTATIWALRCGLSDVESGDGPADDHTLDLRRAREDREDLRGAVPVLYREVSRVAVAPEDLDRLLGDPDRGLPRDELRHRTLGALERQPVPGHPGGPPRQQARGVHRRVHVGARARDALVLPDRLAELDPLSGVLGREF